MTDFIDTAWAIVNEAETKAQLVKAEEWVKANVNDNDLFDDLMRALSFKWREAHYG